VSKEEYLKVNVSDYILRLTRVWPNKESIASTLATDLERARRNRKWPPIGSTELHTVLVGLGCKVGTAKTVEDCVDAYVEALRHFACPEPGWDGEGVDLVSSSIRQRR
jgi:hypothetical protein